MCSTEARFPAGPGAPARYCRGERCTWEPLAPLLCPGTALGVRVAPQPLPRSLAPGGSPALPCPQPCPGLAVKSGLRARRCAGQPSAPPPSFAAAWLLSRGAPSSSPLAAGGRSPNAFIPYVHAVNPLLPVPVPRSPAFPCRLVRSALPPSCCRTD